MLPISAEVCCLDRKSFKEDALELWVGLTIYLLTEQEKHHCGCIVSELDSWVQKCVVTVLPSVKSYEQLQHLTSEQYTCTALKHYNINITVVAI